MAIIEVDFTGAPPAQGGGSDRVPPGRYVLKVTEMLNGTTAAGDKRMITAMYEIASGPEAGKNLQDRFVWGGDEKASKFGLQRFHAFLQALGAPTKEGKIRFDTDRIVGRACEAQVGDQEMKANGEFDARIISQPRAYYTLGSSAAAAKTAAPTVAVAAAPKAAPKAAAPSPVAKAAPAPVVVEEEAEEVTLDAEEASDISDEVDDLFA